MNYSKQYRSKIFIIEKQQARITEMLRLIDTVGLTKYNNSHSYEFLNDTRFIRSDNGEERSGSEVQAYYQALRTASSKPFKLSEEAIRNLHADIFKSSSDNNHRGSYRTNGSGTITLSGGGEQLTFSSAEPCVIKKSLKTLIRWTIDELNKKELHVITIISAFVYEFLIIHPFKDGNGRTSRALMYLLLIESGYEFLRFTPLDNYLQENKRLYMRCIVDAQLYRGTSKEKIGNFIYFNYKCIYELLESITSAHN